MLSGNHSAMHAPIVVGNLSVATDLVEVPPRGHVPEGRSGLRR